MKNFIFVCIILCVFHLHAFNASKDCYGTLTSDDIQILNQINDETSHYDKLDNQEFDKILEKYEYEMSNALKRAVVADFYHRVINEVADELRDNVNFARSYLNFSEALTTYRLNRQKIFGGIRSLKKDDDLLIKARVELEVALNNVRELSPEVRKTFKIGMYKALLATYQEGNARIIDIERQINLAMIGTGTLAISGALAMSFLTSGLSSWASGAVITATGSQVAGTLTGLALHTVSSSLGGAGFVAGLSYVKEFAYSLAGNLPGPTPVPESSFYCRLADDFEKNDKKLFHDAFRGAIIGGIWGLSMGTLGVFSPQTVATIRIIGRYGSPAFSSILTGYKGYEAMDLFKRAYEASLNGDEALAKELTKEFQKKIIDATVDGIGIYIRFKIASHTKKSFSELFVPTIDGAIKVVSR